MVGISNFFENYQYNIGEEKKAHVLTGPIDEANIETGP
jgi:hypothetical protein